MIKKLKYSNLIAGIILLSMASSCLKKDNIPDFTKVAPVIEFPLGGPGLVKNTLSAFSSDVIDTAIALNIASPDPLKTSAVITVQADASVVAAYNTANGTNYTALPSTLYELVSDKVTINAGFRVGRLKIKIKFNQFDPTKNYMLGLSIADAPGLLISGNFGKFLWEFVVKNPFEGNYLSTGQITLYNGTDVASGVAAVRNFNNRAIAATTVNGSTFQTILADLGAPTNLLYVTVNSSTNAVTVSPAPVNSFAVVENNGTNTYNPATKTFTLNFRYFNASGFLRQVSQTMVKQ